MLLGEQNLVSLRILILSPATRNGCFARDCLETRGGVAIAAVTEAELLALLHIAWTDLTILDGEDSRALQVLDTLKADPATMLVPLLVVCSSDEQARLAMAAGADEAVTRSGGPRSFLAVAESLLEQADVRRQVTTTVMNRERTIRSRFRTTICRYLSPQLADLMLVDLDAKERDVPRQSTRAQAAVLFADMRGFTMMAERLGPADTLKVLNEYFSMLAEITFRHDGTIFNMSGDSLMIGYGVPVEQHDSTARAIQTAAEMLLGFRELAAQWRDRHDIQVGLGIGINDGEVLAGDVGSSRFMSYTMIGDTVNVAARLSQRARAGEVLFSGSVKRSLDEHGYDIRAVALPPLTLRGRSGPLDIFCVPLDERLSVDV